MTALTLALVIPWAIIMNNAPLMAAGVITAAPRTTKPMWLTLE